jgi:hypothetical protein
VAERVARGHEFSAWFEPTFRRFVAERNLMSLAGVSDSCWRMREDAGSFRWLSSLYWTKRVSSRNLTFCCASVVARGE